MGTDYSRVPTLVQNLGELLRSGQGSDLVFIVGDGKEKVRLQAHRTIIAARCRRLKRQIVEDLRTSKCDTEIQLARFTCDDVHNVLQYVYTGTIRLNSANAIPVYDIANELGIPALLATVRHHIDKTTTTSNVLGLLQQSLNHDFSGITAQLVTYIGSNAKEILQISQFQECTPAAIDAIVRHEDIQVPESELWTALVKWGCCRTKIEYPPKTDDEKQTIGIELRPFARPGRLRILEFDPIDFYLHVEPFKVIPPRERLLKWKFDAARPAANAWPLDNESFLTRVRRRRIEFESSHPHTLGTRNTTTVTLPIWCTRATVIFDERCELGQYAELSFYRDAECSDLVASLTDTRRTRWSDAKSSVKNVHDVLRIECPTGKFWFKFYAPTSFAARWGFRFTVQTL